MATPTATATRTPKAPHVPNMNCPFCGQRFSRPKAHCTSVNACIARQVELEDMDEDDVIDEG